MLEVLTRKWPQVISICAPAEQLPLDDASVDVVLVGQAWHWFDHERAIHEVRRVLRPGGWLGLVGNGSGERQPWQEQLEALSPDAAGGLQEDHEEEGNPWAHLGLAVCPTSYGDSRGTSRSRRPPCGRGSLRTPHTPSCQRASSNTDSTNWLPSRKPKPTAMDATTSHSSTPQSACAYGCKPSRRITAPLTGRWGGLTDQPPHPELLLAPFGSVLGRVDQDVALSCLRRRGQRLATGHRALRSGMPAVGPNDFVLSVHRPADRNGRRGSRWSWPRRWPGLPAKKWSCTAALSHRLWRRGRRLSPRGVVPR